jgi:MFS family permease
MLASLLGGTVYYFLMVYAQTIWQFAVLMGIWGAMDLFYPIGSNSMIADMVKAEDRLEVYSLMRMVNNAGIAIGPIFAEYWQLKSYSPDFLFGIDRVFYLLRYFLFTVKETLQKRPVMGNEVKIPTRGITMF